MAERHLSRGGVADERGLSRQLGAPVGLREVPQASSAISDLSGLSTTLAILVGDNGCDDDAALDDLLIVCVDVEEREA